MDQENEFSDEIVRAFGLQNAPKETWDDFFHSAIRAIAAAALRKAEDRLSPDKQDELYRLLTTASSDEEKAAFFKTHLPDFKDILLEETIRFRNDALQYGREHSIKDNPL